MEARTRFELALIGREPIFLPLEERAIKIGTLTGILTQNTSVEN